MHRDPETICARRDVAAGHGYCTTACGTQYAHKSITSLLADIKSLPACAIAIPYLTSLSLPGVRLAYTGHLWSPLTICGGPRSSRQGGGLTPMPWPEHTCNSPPSLLHLGRMCSEPYKRWPRRTLHLYTEFFMIAASSTSLRSQCASNMPISMRRWNEPF